MGCLRPDVRSSGSVHPSLRTGSLWEVLRLWLLVRVCVGTHVSPRGFSCTLVFQGLCLMCARGGFVSGRAVIHRHFCLTSALPFLFLQLEGDAITLKPRPSADLTNSSAPSPSHKVQRSVSANPKQRRFSDQGECFAELRVGDSPSAERSQVLGALDDTAEFPSLFSHSLDKSPPSAKWDLPRPWQDRRRAPARGSALTHVCCPSGPAAGPAIPTSNSYSKKTQSNNAENKRPEEDRESGRKASSTAKVPASPLPGLERKKTTPTPSTVSHAIPLLPQASPAPPARPRLWGPHSRACPLQAAFLLIQTHSL